jgi:hypothetical protein
MGILALTDLRQWSSEREYMPLLRSLADRAACVAISMALLTELFASPPPSLRRVNDACKVQRGLAHPRTLSHGRDTR